MRQVPRRATGMPACPDGGRGSKRTRLLQRPAWLGGGTNRGRANQRPSQVCALGHTAPQRGAPEACAHQNHSCCGKTTWATGAIGRERHRGGSLSSGVLEAWASCLLLTCPSKASQKIRSFTSKDSNAHACFSPPPQLSSQVGVLGPPDALQPGAAEPTAHSSAALRWCSRLSTWGGDGRAGRDAGS